MDRYEVVRMIGKGSFGKVYLVWSKGPNRQQYVIKTIPLSDAKESKAAQQEVKLLASLHNPFIVQYHESFTERGILHICMEFCDGGDLAGVIKQYQAKRRYIKEDVRIVRNSSAPDASFSLPSKSWTGLPR